MTASRQFIRSLPFTLGVMLIISAFPSSLYAASIQHTIAKGESLAGIALEFYGNRSNFREIALFNRIENPALVRPTMKIRLPFSELVTMREGESISMLAKKEWGNPKLFPILAAANGIRNPQSVPVGTRLRIPVMVPYTLGGGESLSTVARDFYGNPKAYTSIALASGISHPDRVPVGTALRIPLILIRSSAGGGAKAVGVRPGKRTFSGLKEAQGAYRRGEFEKARDLIERRLSVLRGKDRAKALRLLASCYYAFGEREKVIRTLKESYALDPGFVPDPAMVNPDMITLYVKAKGLPNR
ncbi:MAG: LysM peptidoglycan-binding domain-containing protein [Deltaproteobacteria bacterium]|nr:LysM peptidoglycan-binding domain-containing protein [Deltaproteobacteria bacterium]